jgi:hypothetical protein
MSRPALRVRRVVFLHVDAAIPRSLFHPASMPVVCSGCPWGRSLSWKGQKKETARRRLCQPRTRKSHRSSVQGIIFETRKDEIDGAFVTTCPGH